MMLNWRNIISHTFKFYPTNIIQALNESLHYCKHTHILKYDEYKISTVIWDLRPSKNTSCITHFILRIKYQL